MKLVAVGVMASALALGQWLHTPTPSVPRTADGKPDLNAPAPKAADGHPDLSGVWTANSRPLQDLSIGVANRDIPYQPWSEQLTKQRANGARGKDDPAAHCVPASACTPPACSLRPPLPLLVWPPGSRVPAG